MSNDYVMRQAVPVSVKLVKDPGDDEYRVLVDGVDIGVVFRSRFSGVGSMRHQCGKNRSDWGVGHWGWVGDPAPEGEYATRREAVADMVNAYQRRNL